MLKKLFAWNGLTLAVLFLAGCGQTGPLYLPKPQTVQNTSHAHTSAKAQDQTKYV